MKEIEAKFRVDQRAMFAEFERTAILGPYTLMPTPGIEFQHNTYYDTLDLRLSAHHCSLRVREVKSRRIGAFKRSLQTQAGIHSREEWEIELDAGDDLDDWPDSQARDQALAAIGGAEVLPVVAVRTKRQFVYAIRAAVVVAEICLDEGMIEAGEHTTEFRELEIELLAGHPRAELDELIRQLRARYPLVPEMLGKKARGLALLDSSDTARPISRFVDKRVYEFLI